MGRSDAYGSAADEMIRHRSYGGLLGIHGGLLGIALTKEAAVRKWTNRMAKSGDEVDKLERKIATLERARAAGKEEVEKLRRGFPGLFDSRKTVDVDEALRRNKERLVRSKKEYRSAEKKWIEAKARYGAARFDSYGSASAEMIRHRYGGLPIQPAEDQPLQVVPRVAAGVDVGMVELVPSIPDSALPPGADLGATEGAAEFLMSRGIQLDPNASGVAEAIAQRFGGENNARFYRRSRNRW